jgi:hypothetical protein
MSRVERLARIEALLQRLDAAVVVRDPGNARAAEQFEGLRKQIALAAKNHRAHVGHLLSLSDSAKKGASAELLGERVDDFLAELGVMRISEYTYPELFEVVEEIEGNSDKTEILEPAVVERLESGEFNRLRLGKVRKTFGPQPEHPVVPKLEGETTRDEFSSVTVNVDSSAPPRLLLGIVAVALTLLGILLGRTVFDGSDQEVDSPPAASTVVVDLTTTSTIVGG